MRTRALAAAAVCFVLALALPSSSPAESSCEGTSCGAPDCYEPTVRLRPGLTRGVSVQCRNARAARLITPPGASDVSNVTADYRGLHFEARPHDGAPRYDEAVFEIDGFDGKIELTVQIVVIPTEENHAPVCYGDSLEKRTDGSGPVDLFLHPFCYDQDGDDFVMEGGPPGVHSQSPKHVPAGENVSNWDYRTATSSGEETTTVWATDVLGARSADAELKVKVGALDHPPECTPNGYSWDEVLAVYMRPGKTRRFGLICTDPDSDLFVSTLTSLPERGALATVEGPPSYGFWGVERFSDATYVPLDESLDPDPFSFGAVGVRGAGPPRRMAMVPKDLPFNSGGGCGWSPANVISPGPGILWAHCDDNEGDDPIVEVITQPKHGTLGPTLVATGLYGWNDITIPYVPELGYEGYDCIEIRVSDGHGTTFKLPIDIWVKPPVDLPELPDPPELPVVPEPPTLPDDPVLPDEPSAPDQPTLPFDPIVPDEPSQPNDPVIPDPPNLPDNPVVPDEPSAPNEPAEQTPPVLQDPPASPAALDESGADEVPSPPDHPALPENTPPEDPPAPPDEIALEVPAPPDHTPPATRSVVPPEPSAPAPPAEQRIDPPLPVAPPPPAVTLDPGQSSRSVVKRILGTKSVKRVQRAGDVEVWARSKLSRRELLRNGQAAGIVVICRSSCQVRSGAELVAGTRAIRSSRQKTATDVMAGQPHVLSLALGDADRETLGRLRKPRATFRLTIRAGTARARSVKRSIPVS